MSRLANPALVKPFNLGPCQCDGAPHPEGDMVELPEQVPAGDFVDLDDNDPIGQVLPFIRGWNLLENGQPVAVDRDSVRLLSADDLKAISNEITRRMRWNPVPNASAARSRNSSRGSGSQIRQLRTAG